MNLESSNYTPPEAVMPPFPAETSSSQTVEISSDVTRENWLQKALESKERFHEQLLERPIEDLIYAFERLGGELKNLEGGSPQQMDELEMAKKMYGATWQNHKLQFITDPEAFAAVKQEIERRLKNNEELLKTSGHKM